MITDLNISELSLQRGDRVLFSGLSLHLRAGQVVALTGANGSGKTSLLRAVAGFIHPLAGRITFGGQAGALDADDARRRQIHLVGHQDGLKSHRTAREELIFQVCWTGGTQVDALVAAEHLGLTRLLDLEVRKLSAGQKRRLALARLVAAPRDIWLLDEPLSPLDQCGRVLFGALMTQHLQSGGLILAAVHDPLPIAARAVEIGA